MIDLVNAVFLSVLSVVVLLVLSYGKITLTFILSEMDVFVTIALLKVTLNSNAFLITFSL